MRGFRLKMVLPGFLLLLALAGCGSSGPGVADSRVAVFAGIPPLGWLVERVGAGAVNCAVLVEPGQSAHSFEPAPAQVAALARARLYFTSGLPFEEAIAARARQSFPNLELVDLRQGLALLALTGPLHLGGGSPDGDSHEHAAGEPDPHFWLDPQRMRTAAGTICEALCRAKPESTELFRNNLAQVQSDLEALDRRLERRLEPYRGRTFYVFHPAFGYFAARYGLTQAAVEAGGHEPSARELARLVDRLRADRAGTLFIQRQFALSAAASLEHSLGLRLVALDPQPADYLSGLDEIGRQIADSFESASGMN